VRLEVLRMHSLGTILVTIPGATAQTTLQTIKEIIIMTKDQLAPLGTLRTPPAEMIAGEVTMTTGKMMVISISDPEEVTMYALLAPL